MKISEISSSETVLYNKAVALLRTTGLKAKDPKTARLSKAKHIRIENSIADIETAVKRLGANIHYENVPNLSGKFTAFAIEFPEAFNDIDLAGATIYALSNLKGDTKVSQKQLIPAKLGLGKGPYTRSSLFSLLQSNIPKFVEDETLQQFLLQLTSVAIGQKQQVDKDVMDQLNSDTVRITGIDFGEVLTPLMLSDDSDQITFPVGNAMLADVEINGTPYSVKSASGSGTSFRAIKQYMNSYQEAIKNGSITLDADTTAIHNFFRAFVDTNGSNIDKIIAASAAANTLEHQALEKLLNKPNFTYKDLISFSNRFNDYGKFLKAIYPVTVAGGYKIKDKDRPNGLPADYQFYMGLSDKKPVSKQAGKPSWDADKGSAGANILTYVLGTSFLADAKKIEKANKYNSMIKDILGSVHASLAKIDITSDGKIQIKKTPFSKLNYQFQYHAPSHIPGNNLPGFSLILD